MYIPDVWWCQGSLVLKLVNSFSRRPCAAPGQGGICIGDQSINQSEIHHIEIVGSKACRFAVTCPYTTIWPKIVSIYIRTLFHVIQQFVQFLPGWSGVEKKNANNSISNTCFDENQKIPAKSAFKCESNHISQSQPAMSLHPALRWCAHSWAPRLAARHCCWSLTHNRWCKHAQRLKPWGWHAMKPRSFRRLSRKSSKELPGKWRKRLPAGKVATCNFHLEDTPIYRVVRMMLVCMRNGWTPWWSLTTDSQELLTIHTILSDSRMNVCM